MCFHLRESYGLRSLCFRTAQMDKLHCVMRNNEAWHPLETANKFHNTGFSKAEMLLHGSQALFQQSWNAKHIFFSWNGCFLKWWYPPFHTPKWSFLVGTTPGFVGETYHHFRVHPQMEDLNLVDSKVQPLVPKHSQRLRRLNRLGDSEMVDRRCGCFQK